MIGVKSSEAKILNITFAAAKFNKTFRDLLDEATEGTVSNNIILYILLN